MSKQRLVFVMILGGAIAALVGCELAVDFDRSKIPADSTDAGTLDVSVPSDSGGNTDSGATDGGGNTTDGSTFDSGAKDSGASDSGSSDAETDAPDGD
jgi:hypothetical protein